MSNGYGQAGAGARGPAWFAAGRYLVWSDIPNDRLLRFDDTDSSVSVFRQPSQNANGNSVDGQGRLVTCEHLARRVTRTEHDGTVTVLADSFNGMKLNSPNDLVVKSDGSIWFTDPPYGIITDYEGVAPTARSAPAMSTASTRRAAMLRAVATDYVKPNGLAFSPDEAVLYVADTGRSHDPDGPAHIRRHNVSQDGAALIGGEVLTECSNGLFDGFRVDRRGRIWASAGDGVHCTGPEW